MKMTSWFKATGAAALAAGAMLATPGDTDAAKVMIAPWGFPFADCGTVGYADSWLNTDGSGEGTCLAWFADSTGSAYIFSGLDNFEVGDRFHVKGTVCNICLTSCFASAMFNVTIGSCEPPEQDWGYAGSK